MEKPVRSLTKALSWRILATSTTMFLVFIFTGDLLLSGGVGLSELSLKILVYYVHERVWNIIGFGRARKVE